MSNPLLRATWSNVRATCNRLGIDLADLTADLDRLDEQARAAADVPTWSTVEVGAALVECGETGADPLEHPALIHAAVARALAESGAGSVTAWAAAHRAELLTAAAPGLLSALSERVSEAQKVITSARSKGVPVEALPSRDYALRPELETPAALARDAVADAEAAVSAWRSLAEAVGLCRVGAHETAFIAADLPAETYDAMNREERARVVSVVVKGHGLDVPADVETFEARRTRLLAEREANARRQAEHAHLAVNRHAGYMA